MDLRGYSSGSLSVGLLQSSFSGAAGAASETKELFVANGNNAPVAASVQIKLAPELAPKLAPKLAPELAQLKLKLALTEHIACKLAEVRSKALHWSGLSKAAEIKLYLLPLLDYIQESRITLVLSDDEVRGLNQLVYNHATDANSNLKKNHGFIHYQIPRGLTFFFCAALQKLGAPTTTVAELKAGIQAHFNADINFTEANVVGDIGRYHNNSIGRTSSWGGQKYSLNAFRGVAPAKNMDRAYTVVGNKYFNKAESLATAADSSQWSHAADAYRIAAAQYQNIKLQQPYQINVRRLVATAKARVMDGKISNHKQEYDAADTAFADAYATAARAFADAAKNFQELQSLNNASVNEQNALAEGAAWLAAWLQELDEAMIKAEVGLPKLSGDCWFQIGAIAAAAKLDLKIIYDYYNNAYLKFEEMGLQDEAEASKKMKMFTEKAEHLMTAGDLSKKLKDAKKAATYYFEAAVMYAVTKNKAREEAVLELANAQLNLLSGEDKREIAARVDPKDNQPAAVCLSQGNAAYNAALVALTKGEHTPAVILFEIAAEHYHQANNKALVGTAWLSAGKVLVGQGNYVAASTALENATMAYKDRTDEEVTICKLMRQGLAMVEAESYARQGLAMVEAKDYERTNFTLFESGELIADLARLIVPKTENLNDAGAYLGLAAQYL